MEKHNVARAIACVFVIISTCIIWRNTMSPEPLRVSSGYDICVEDLPTRVDGLSCTFYNDACPNLESIVKSIVTEELNKDITQAAGLLRLHFHDCFVQGCDASVLLTGTGSEQDGPPNRSLRPRAFEIIGEIKAAVEANCSGVVSCADILTLAARDSVAKAGGPNYPLRLGRRDSLHPANQAVVLANLPSPTSNVTQLMSLFGPKGFTLTELVALSGGHTIGIAHCKAFQNRLYNISTGEQIADPTLDPTFAKSLYFICPEVNDTKDFTVLDVRTPNRFDNKYYVNVQNKQALLTSDQTLYADAATTGNIVESFASDHLMFFHKFIDGMLKMGQLDVLTGSQGEIRSNCSVANRPTSSGHEEL